MNQSGNVQYAELLKILQKWADENQRIRFLSKYKNMGVEPSEFSAEIDARLSSALRSSTISSTTDSGPNVLERPYVEIKDLCGKKNVYFHTPRPMIMEQGKAILKQAMIKYNSDSKLPNKQKDLDELRHRLDNGEFICSYFGEPNQKATTIRQKKRKRAGCKGIVVEFLNPNFESIVHEILGLEFEARREPLISEKALYGRSRLEEMEAMYDDLEADNKSTTLHIMDDGGEDEDEHLAHHLASVDKTRNPSSIVPPPLSLSEREAILAECEALSDRPPDEDLGFAEAIQASIRDTYQSAGGMLSDAQAYAQAMYNSLQDMVTPPSPVPSPAPAQEPEDYDFDIDSEYAGCTPDDPFG